MSDIFNADFKDFIKSLNNNEVEYILVGGYAVIIHGYNRTTGDMDIWVNRTKENYEKIVKSFHEFGMPIFDMTEKNFLYKDEFDVFSFGIPPISIDLMTNVKGLEFKKCFKKAEFQHLEGISIKVLHFNDLIRAKKASNRSKDQDDIEHLTS
ncbi:MAG: nucleotidyltransferase [Saprospiraceae bacterium]